MKRISVLLKATVIALVLVLTISSLAYSEGIDLSNMSIDQLENLRSQIDERLSLLRRAGGQTYVPIDNFAEYVRNQAAHEQEKVSLYGTVVQVYDDGDDTYLRIAMDDDYDKMFYIYFESVPRSIRVIENETVTVYGTFIGDWTYNTVLSSRVTVPGINADDIVPGVVKKKVNEKFDGTRENPIPIGETARYYGGRYDDNSVVDFEITSIIRGKKALEQVKNFNRYNSNPKKGKEYILIKMKVSVISSDNNKASLSDYYIQFVDKGGVQYESSYIVDLTPAMSDMYVGASQEIYLCGEVDPKDTPYLVYSKNDESPIWFGPFSVVSSKK